MNCCKCGLGEADYYDGRCAHPCHKGCLIQPCKGLAPSKPQCILCAGVATERGEYSDSLMYCKSCVEVAEFDRATVECPSCEALIELLTVLGQPAELPPPPLQVTGEIRLQDEFMLIDLSADCVVTGLAIDSDGRRWVRVEMLGTPRWYEEQHFRCSFKR